MKSRVTPDHAVLQRAAASLKRASKAADAIEGDAVAWRIVTHAINTVADELDAIDAEGRAYALPESLNDEPLTFG